MKKEQNKDWADDLPDDLLKELELALEESVNGNDFGTLNTEMILKYKEKYPHLNQ
jgi:hypothetical protein